MKAELSPTVVGRLTRERLFWLATVRSEGTPHLAPLWYIWHDACLYVFTGGIKLHNLQTNPEASVALQDGIRPVILEGEARPVADDRVFEDIAARYRARFAWDISAEPSPMKVLEIIPRKVLHWNGEARAEELPIPSQLLSPTESLSATLQRAQARLQREHIIWLATVRPEGRPHLVPIWHVWYQGNLYISTGQNSVKMRNLCHQPWVAAALPDALDVVIVEGEARPAPELNDELAPQFIQKFGWDFRKDREYGGLVRIEPSKILAWQGDYRQETKHALKYASGST
jgi:nitroimidazol reductase NimA-like FMN-containing flavoprotein (pyridoxamine 5'-phosphate oxidase superfamily)